MKFLLKSIGGSRSYGLDTPTSDIDYRGIFINTEIGKIIGLDRHEHLDIKSVTEDAFYFEFRHYLNSLRKTNTQAVELLFLDPKCILEKDPYWDVIVTNRNRLLDTKRLYGSVKGYIFGEKRLAFGERTGKLGGKRKEALDKFGYSFKNVVQARRLIWAATHFLRSGIFPVDTNIDPNFRASLMDIKLNPGAQKVDDLKFLLEEEEKVLDRAFENRVVDYTFDVDLANDFCLAVYWEILEKAGECFKIN